MAEPTLSRGEPALPGARARVAALFRARLAMARRGGWPIPALVFLAALAAALALLVRDLLPPEPWAFFALASGGLVLCPPLLSDLGAILRHDEGQAWLGALPALALERTLARALHLFALLAALVAAWFVPWALLAPAPVGALARVALPVLGLVQALFLATLLVWAQQLLLARAQALLVLFETAVMAGTVLGFLALLGNLRELAALEPARSDLAWLPSAWLAHAMSTGGATLLAPAACALACLGALFRVPAAEERRGPRRGLVERWLAPLRALALRAWVRPEERGAFELVYAGLPREREVALRTYPMLGIALAFLLAGAFQARSSGAVGEPWRADLLALLLFTAGVYLPVLLTHVPLTETPEASWILRLAPRPRSAIEGGAIKALFVRWVLPLYLVLLGLGLALGQAPMLARLWLPAVLLALFLLRHLYPRCVRGLPLSTGPEELRGEIDWAGTMTGLALLMTLLAVLANRYLSWPASLVLGLVLAMLELGLGARRARAG